MLKIDCFELAVFIVAVPKNSDIYIWVWELKNATTQHLMLM